MYISIALCVFSINITWNIFKLGRKINYLNSVPCKFVENEYCRWKNFKNYGLNMWNRDNLSVYIVKSTWPQKIHMPISVSDKSWEKPPASPPAALLTGPTPTSTSWPLGNALLLNNVADGRGQRRVPSALKLGPLG